MVAVSRNHLRHSQCSYASIDELDHRRIGHMRSPLRLDVTSGNELQPRRLAETSRILAPIVYLHAVWRSLRARLISHPAETQ